MVVEHATHPRLYTCLYKILYTALYTQTTSLERAISIAVMILGGGCYGFIIGSMTSLMTQVAVFTASASSLLSPAFRWLHIGIGRWLHIGIGRRHLDVAAIAVALKTD